MCHFVLSLGEREKRDRRDSRRDLCLVCIGFSTSLDDDGLVLHPFQHYLSHIEIMEG